MSQTAPPAKFPWESAVPEGSFFQSLGNDNFGRQFLRVFTQEEASAMDLDSKTELDLHAKLSLLESLVLQRMTDQPLPGPPESLSHEDFENKWHRREFLLAHLQRSLAGAKVVEAEERYRHMIAVWAGRDHSQKKWPEDLGSIDNLGILLTSEKRYAEAEVEFRKLIALIRQAPDLGYDSPMNVGIVRKLAEVVGKQGRLDEGFSLIEEASHAIDALAKGKFAKYEQETRTFVAETKRKLGRWQTEGLDSEEPTRF